MPTSSFEPSEQPRRAFIRQTGTLMGGSLLLSALPGWAQGTPYVPHERKIRLGIVGGRFGATFQFHQHPNCTVAAVSDLRPERREHLKKTYRCDRSYDSLEQLLKDRSLEAVFLATPAPDHVPHTLQALRAGKHVLCAVPAAMTLEECQELIDTVKRTGLTYMMAETSYWQQSTISARHFYREGKFGHLYYTESAYHHDGLEALFFENGQRTWRHGFAPMQYPTHCTAHLVSVTGERLVEVSCQGWGDDDPRLKDNVYNNPFWNETAFFQTDRGNSMQAAIWWKGAHRGTERAEYFGDKMSFFFPNPHGLGASIVRKGQSLEKDSGGFERHRNEFAAYTVPEWWNTELLPPSLRHSSGHEGSHTFITHEFIDALVRDRRPAIDVYEAIAYTAPGLVAHQSALQGGERLKIPSFDPVAKS